MPPPFRLHLFDRSRRWPTRWAPRRWSFGRAALDDDRPDRGDVPGWVLVTLMTAGLVLALWAVAGPRFVEVFNDSIDSVVGGP